jgi:hypothetical protein
MDSPSDSIMNRLTDAGFGLGPFAFARALESKLEEEFKYDQFQKDLREQFLEQISDATLQFLYETCIQARVERAVMNKARELMTAREWRQSGKDLRKLAQMLNNGAAVKVEARLRSGLGNSEDSRSRNSAAALSKDVFGLYRVCALWEGIARSDLWKKYYAGYIWVLNRHLAKTIPTKEKRADIIAVAIQWTKLESPVSQDAVLKSLTRGKGNLRRYVFTDVGTLIDPSD